MHVASTCKEASHVIVQSDLVTGNRIPGDRHDDSDTSGNMQRRNSTEVLEGSRLPELGRSACTNRTQTPAYCRVRQFRTPKLTGQVIWRAYPSLLSAEHDLCASPRWIVCPWVPGLNH